MMASRVSPRSAPATSVMRTFTSRSLTETVWLVWMRWWPLAGLQSIRREPSLRLQAQAKGSQAVATRSHGL